MIWALGFAFFLFSHSADAYLLHNPNRDLIEEVSRQNYRILPRSSDYAIAIDGDFFKPVFLNLKDIAYYQYDFYHGNGYWLDLRTEYRPLRNLTLDLKTTITQGTTSNGPTYKALLIPRAGLTYRVDDFLGFSWETRLSDIDRQTVGAGLFVQEKQTSGGYIAAERGDLRARVMVDGTGSFSLDGGLIAYEADYAEGLVGASLLMVEQDIDYHPPQFTATLFSRHRWENGIFYGLEYGSNPNSNAGLAFVGLENRFGALDLRFKPQYRRYGKRIMGDYAGNVSHNYVGYDLNDLPFTTFMNIMAYGDHVQTYSSELDLTYTFNRFYRAFGELEGIYYDFQERPAVSALFYRAGFRFFPFRDREDQFCLLIGNRYLIASTVGTDGRTFSPPDGIDFENKPLFMRQTYWMVNYSVHL